MGRIEDALKRAAAEKEGEGTSLAPPETEDRQAPFVSPWHAEQPAAAAPNASPRNTTRTLPVTRAPKEPAAAPANVPSGSASLRLESQLAMGWPQPFDPSLNGKLVVMRQTDPAAIESYVRLATACKELQSRRGIKSMLVTSSAAAEGKTLTAMNVALLLAQHHGRVLLVDADLEHPRIHLLFQVTARAGLNDLLTSGGELRTRTVDVTGQLTLLPAGPVRSNAGSLDSPRMRELLAEARRDFDWVIIDGAPVLPLSSATLGAKDVDGVVFVIDAGRTPRKTVEEAVDAIGRDRILGLVLNRG